MKTTYNKTSDKYKYKTKLNGQTVQHGAKGYSISVGTKKGDAFCARSLGIKKKYPDSVKNELNRKVWRCKGSKSIK